MRINIHAGNPIVVWIIGLGLILMGGYVLRDTVIGLRSAMKEKRFTLVLMFELLAEFVTLYTLGFLVMFIAGLLLIISLAVQLFMDGG